MNSMITLDTFFMIGLDAFILSGIVFIFVLLKGLKHPNLKNQLNIIKFIKLFIIFWAVGLVISLIVPKLVKGYSLEHGFGLGRLLMKNKLQFELFEGQDGKQELRFTPEQRATLSSYLTDEQIKKLEEQATSTLEKQAKVGLSKEDKEVLSGLLTQKQLKDLSNKIKEEAGDKLKRQHELLKKVGIKVDSMVDTTKAADALINIGKLSSNEPISDLDKPLDQSQLLPKEIMDEEEEQREEEEEEEEEEQKIVDEKQLKIASDNLVLNSSFIDRAPLFGTFASNRDSLDDYVSIKK